MGRRIGFIEKRMGRAFRYHRLPAAALGVLCLSVVLHAEVVAEVVSPVLPPPPVDGDFRSNFSRPEFYMPLVSGADAAFGKDLGAQYHRIYYKIEPGKEILIVGEFPRARYFSVTVYDDHGAIVDTLYDAELVPLRFFDGNPFSVGGPAAREDQLYAITVRLGDEVAGTPLAGCANSNWDVHSNTLDARFRHTHYSRYSSDQSGFVAQFDQIKVPHDDGEQNTGGMIGIRVYLPGPRGVFSRFDLSKPVVWLRDTATGCGYQLSDVPGETLNPDNWYQYEDVVNAIQAEAHNRNENDLGNILPPGGLDYFNGLRWFGGKEYQLHGNPDSGFLTTLIGEKNAPARLNQEARVLRLRMRLPEMPCKAEVCRLTGDEELRYWGLSIIDSMQMTLATLTDIDLVTDADGYATVIVTFGTALPAHVSAESGYTVLSLTDSGAQEARWMALRNILSSPGFVCGTERVPPRTSEHHPNGGYVGEYVPYADYPLAADLAETAEPLLPETISCAPPEDWPAPYCCSIVAAWAIEGEPVTFKAWRWGKGVDEPRNLAFATVVSGAGEGYAEAPADFTGAAGTLTFNAGETETLFTVTTLADDLAEGQEVFDVTLSDVNDGTLLDTGQGTIVDDDVPTFSALPVSVTEGGVVTFTVTRSMDSTQIQSIDFNVGVLGGDTAEADDFIESSGTLTFSPGESSKTIPVETAADTVFEDDETFSLLLTNVTGGDFGGLVGTRSVQATILEDDPAPKISVAGAAALEGGDVVFALTREGEAGEVQSVDFNAFVGDGDTASEADFSPLSGTLIFNPGDSAHSITVKTLDDGDPEADETFSLTLANPTGGPELVVSSVKGTIIDDDPLVP